MKKRYLIIFFLFSFFQSFPQSTNVSTLFKKNISKGDYFFDHFAYRNALQIYARTYKRDPDNVHVRERIAMCYFKLHDPVSAERWYHTLAKEPDIHAEAKFEYAEALSMNGKYAESARWFREYLKERPDDKLALDKLGFLNTLARYTKNDLRFLVSEAGFNSDHSEYGAHYFHDGVVFASSRDNDLFIKHKPPDGVSVEESLLNLYYTRTNKNDDAEEPVPFHARKLKTFYHEGPMAFYDNFRKGAFTQSNLKNNNAVYDSMGKVNLRIYFAEVAHLGEFLHVDPFPYNSNEYSNAHPTFSADGKIMYFSSTMPGGYGESDLYYSRFANGRWTKPVNLGDAINTREDESFPFIANDTTLYFSSNGHGTLGGLDIYVSYKREGKFGNPVNIGSPINTRFDDFSWVTDSTGRAGYIASNRDGGKGLDDIYWFIAKFFLLAGEVSVKNNPEKKIPGARILAFDNKGALIDSARSDSSGYFMLDLPFDKDIIIKADKPGFELVDDIPFSTQGKPFGIDSLTIPLWRPNLFAKGRIFSKETQSLLPGAAVVLHNLTRGSSDSLMVDEKGEYVFLVRPGRKYRIEGIKEGYIPNGFNLDTRGMSEGELLNDIVMEEISIDKQTIRFDYGKEKISDQSAKLLNMIVRTLKKFPGASVNIGAHADSRGTRDFNDLLSKERALSTRKYLLAKGISARRIHLSWFGEELILNMCSDGVECSEEQHSLNRRAELKVQKVPID